MKGEPPISSVYRHGEPAPEPLCEMVAYARAQKIRRQIWQDHGIVAVTPAELPPGLRDALAQWATIEHGPRPAKFRKGNA